MGSLPPFQYSRLAGDGRDGFRIMTILPGDDNAPIECTLSNLLWPSIENSEDGLSSNAQPDYEALSYAWGEEKETQEISIGGQSFIVTPALEQALYCLRLTDKPRTVWVDAVCIDQNNALEKGFQVKEMHRVFSNASWVIAWLGPASHDSQLGMDFAQELHRLASISKHQLHVKKAAGSDTVTHLLVPEHASRWRALHRVLDRDWWERAWIVQEVVVAKDVMMLCGTATLPWAVIRVASGVLLRAYENVAMLNSFWKNTPEAPLKRGHRRNMNLLHSLVCAREAYVTYQEEHGERDWAITFLGKIERRRCRFDHDRVFSLLALTSSTFTSFIKVEYDQPIEEVFKAVVKASIEESRSLAILAYAQNAIKQPNLPSFVPDWRLPVLCCPFPGRPHKHPAAIKISEDLSSLTVKGYTQANIVDVNVEHLLLPNVVRRANKKARSKNSWNMETADFEALFASAMNRWEPEALSDTKFLIIDLMLKLLAQKSPMFSNEKASSRISSPKPVNGRTWSREDCFRLKRRLMKYMRSRKIVSTSQGLMIAPDTVQRGDIMYQISEVSPLVALRPREDGTYMFLGEGWSEGQYDRARSPTGEPAQEEGGITMT